MTSLRGLVLSFAVGLSTTCTFAHAQMIVRVSMASDGTAADGASASSSRSISADGRWVVFTSIATNLVPDDRNGVSDVFVRDLADGSTIRIPRTGGTSRFTAPRTTGRRRAARTIGSGFEIASP